MDIIVQIENDFSITLSEPSKKLVEEAWGKLRNSDDKLNGLDHSLNLLRYLEAACSKINKKLDIEPLVLAIFWHDIWKATKSKLNLFNSLTGLFFEGRFSSKIFLKAAKKSGLPQGLTKATSRVINEHGSFVLYRNSVEGKLFHDIDQLDSENPKRLKAEQKALEGKFLVKVLYGFRRFYPKFFYFKEIDQLYKTIGK